MKGKRITPDIALSADPSNGYTIYMGGKSYVNSIGGTSCSAPLFAGYLGLINLKYPISCCSSLYDVYGNLSKRNLCYKDIIQRTNDNVPTFANTWNAAKGFDLCSGMGSINGVTLYNALISIGLKHI